MAVDDGGVESGLPVVDVKDFLAAANTRRHRATLVIADQRHAALQAAAFFVEALKLPAVYWYSDKPPENAQTCFGTTAFSLLGDEIGALVFDAWSGFDPDAFGALTGSIRAGGLLLLLVPPLEHWPDFNDPQNTRITVAPYSADKLSGRFLKRLARILAKDRDSMLFESGRLTRRPELRTVVPAEVEAVDYTPCRTADQQAAVDALIRVAGGHRRRPVVLTSDRGRGKSAAFGIAAARLIEQGKNRILLTAPRTQAVRAVLQHAQDLLPGVKQAIHYAAPDELVRESVAADLLLVDEAAAIPAAILEQLLKRYARIAFATTVHGYEGTGRGFAIRFSRTLDQHTNSWKALELKTPIRWAADDPLEKLVFRMLALDAEPASAAAFPALTDPGSFSLQRLERDALVGDEQTLSQLFGLLVQAHYRTRPLDLRHLLDGPNIELYVLRSGQHVAATALLAREGGFDLATAEAIRTGKNRPHGHLLPETLAAHQGLLQAPLLRCGRIMRVTVHPALQRRGLGSRLVKGITRKLEAAGYDYIGTSFGATPELLCFWHSLGWTPVRMSIQKGASSGSHSAVFIQPMTVSGKSLCLQARQRFFTQFSHQLSDSLRDLEPALVAGMLRHADADELSLDEADYGDLEAFAEGQRLAEVTIGALWKLALKVLATGQRTEVLDVQEMSLLIVRVLQKNPWSVCVERSHLAGRKQALAVLRSAVRKLL